MFASGSIGPTVPVTISHIKPSESLVFIGPKFSMTHIGPNGSVGPIGPNGLIGNIWPNGSIGSAGHVFVEVGILNVEF